MFVCNGGASKDCRQKKCKIAAYQEKVTYILCGKIAKPAKPVNGIFTATPIERTKKPGG